MVTSVRLSHSRFLKNSPAQKKDTFDKVVTTVWTFEPETSVLTYGATVYKKAGKSDFWNKKEHKEQAMKRFQENPIRVQLLSRDTVPELMSRAIDWFISSHLVFKYGTHNKTNPDVRRVHYENYISDDFNEFYDPYYRREEIQLQDKFQRGRTTTCCDFPWCTFTSILAATAGVICYSQLYL